MARIVIEIKNRALHLREHKLFNSFPISIGRSYHNSIIIPDPFVCLEHISINEKDDKSWEIEDLDSKNGIYLNNKKTNERFIQIKTGDKIRIGHTLIKFISPDEPMAETILIKKGLLNPEGGFLISSAWAALIMCFFYLFAEEYVSTFTKLSLSKLISESIAPAFIPLIWASVWSTIGRISKHHSYFHEQLLVSSIGFFMMLSIQTFSEYIEFIFSSVFIGSAIRYVLETILFLTLLHENFRIATQFKGAILKIYAVIVTIIIMGLSAVEVLASSADFDENPNYSNVLKPLFLKIVPITSKDKFFQDCNDL